VPELRARAMQQFTHTITLLADVVTERAGLPAGNFSARVLAGAVIGAAMAATPGGTTPGHEMDDFRRMDEAFALLAAGLPLKP